MPPAAERTDEELIAAARQGDARAFQVLVERYESRVAAVVVSMLGPGPDADDVGQGDVYPILYIHRPVSRRCEPRHLRHADRDQPVAQGAQAAPEMARAVLLAGCG